MNKKAKALVSSFVAIALSASLATSATYALFTSEDKVNIAVTSGTVSVKAGVSEFEYSTLTQDWTDATQNGEVYEATFDGLGGSATLDGNKVTLDKIVPGDAVRFNVDITNKSTVDVKYRVIVANDTAKDTGLFTGLNVKINGNKFEGEDVGDWTALAPTDGIVETVGVMIELPEDATNTYQGKSCEINVIVEAVQGNAPLADKWDGTVDKSWYDPADTTAISYTLNKSAQVAGLADLVDSGETFEDKTISLAGNLDLGVIGTNGEPVSFQPIGSYADDTAFKGTFDGQGNTVSNMYQSGWALGSGLWDGDDCGLGLFGLVEDATIKNLTIDGANQPSECNLIGAVAGTAFGECVFENITVSNSYSGNHSYYSGGIVGWASGDHKYINCDVTSDTVISSQWGDFNNANGGLIGGTGSSGTYYFEDCDVACVIDAYNDVTSAYEWYSYRNVGMLIGNTGKTKVVDGTTYADASNVTCVNCTVTYGEWANYHYCQFSAMPYPWGRVEAGASTGAYGNARWNSPAIDANGNTVVDDNHAHNPGEGHNFLIVFDQLFGGPVSGDGRTCVYGTATHPGVTVIYNNK